MKQVWISMASLVGSIVVLLVAGVLGSLGLAVLCGFWFAGSAVWHILAVFFSYAERL